MKYEESTVAELRRRSIKKTIEEAAGNNEIEVPTEMDPKKLGDDVADLLARREFAAHKPMFTPDDVVKVTRLAINNGGRLNTNELEAFIRH